MQIILRGRQQHLLEEFLDPAQRRDKSVLVADECLAALKTYISKNLPLVSEYTIPDDVPSQVARHYGTILNGGSFGEDPPGDKEAKIKMHVRTVLSACDGIIQYLKLANQSENPSPGVNDILLPYLDSRYGSSIDASDHSIFTKLTKKFEGRFMEDVRSLNCLDPDEVTRVTEFGPQIVDFVKKVQDNGFAYTTSDGSVYFDIEAFEAANNTYARLEPWNRDNKALQADGEGSLTKKTSEKRSDSDFALWKASKPGEPSWPSPWGNGRPGWHIECSAMASDRLGNQMDIHSGGIDLAFPHHDNELAQSEAYWQDKCHHHRQWVNYFLHMGHLSIQGSKMSKSLKNFTTIRDALGRGDWTPRGLRIVFLLGGWREGIEITEDSTKAGSSWEDKLDVCLSVVQWVIFYKDRPAYNAQNFFVKVIDVLQGPQFQGTKEIDKALLYTLEKTRRGTFAALCDSFNTPTVLSIISDLITTYNSADKADVSWKVTQDIARWVTSMVNTFGLNGKASPDDDVIGWSGLEVPDEARQYLVPLSRLRDSIRQKIQSSSNGLKPEDKQSILESASRDLPPHPAQPNPYFNALHQFHTDLASLEPTSPTLSLDILQLCDRVRDIDLWNVGFYLQDRDASEPALIRRVTPGLRAARQERGERERQREIAKLENEEKAQAKADKGQLSHLEMFRTEEYGEWDQDGIPIKDREGNEITKSRGKKLRKEWERQRKLHEKWLEMKTAAETKAETET